MNTNSQFQLLLTTTAHVHRLVTIMVLISQESYSFNLLSRLYYYRNLQNDQSQWAQGRPEDVLWTSIFDEGTSQSDVPWTGKMYSITSVPNGRPNWTLCGLPLDVLWTLKDVLRTSRRRHSHYILSD